MSWDATVRRGSSEAEMNEHRLFIYVEATTRAPAIITRIKERISDTTLHSGLPPYSKAPDTNQRDRPHTSYLQAICMCVGVHLNKCKLECLRVSVHLARTGHSKIQMQRVAQQTDRQTDKQTDRQADRQTDDKQTDIFTHPCEGLGQRYSAKT